MSMDMDGYRQEGGCIQRRIRVTGIMSIDIDGKII